MGKKRDLSCVILELMDKNRRDMDSFQPGIYQTYDTEVPKKDVKNSINLRSLDGKNRFSKDDCKNRLIVESMEDRKMGRNLKDYISLEKKNKKNLDEEYNRLQMGLLNLEQCYDGELPPSDYANTALKIVLLEEESEETCLKRLNSEVVGLECEEKGTEKGILDVEEGKNEKESREDVDGNVSDRKENAETLLEKLELESLKEEMDEGNEEEEEDVMREIVRTEVGNVNEHQNIVKEVSTCGTDNVSGSVVERDNLFETGGETGEEIGGEMDGETGGETKAKNGNINGRTDELGVCETERMKEKLDFKINDRNEMFESMTGEAEIDEDGKRENKEKEWNHLPRNGGNSDESRFQSKFLFNDELEISSTESGFYSMDGSNEDAPSIVTGSIDGRVLTHPEPDDGLFELHRLAPSSQLMIPGNGQLEFDSTTKWNNVQNKSVSNENPGRQRGDDKQRSEGGCSGGRKSNHQWGDGSGQGFGVSLKQSQMGCGGGCGNGRDDDEDDNRRERFFTGPGSRNEFEKIKLKKKCRLEHGVLTIDEVSILLGELRVQANKLPNVSPHLDEVLKCMTTCHEVDDEGVNCHLCTYVIFLVSHFHSCSRIDCSICLPTVGLTRAFKHRAEDHGEVCNCEHEDLISLKEFAKFAFPMTSSGLVSDDEGSDSSGGYGNVSIEVRDSSGSEDSTDERNDSVKLNHEKQEVDWNRLLEELLDPEDFQMPNSIHFGNIPISPNLSASHSPIAGSSASLPPIADPPVSLPPTRGPTASLQILQGPPTESYPSDFEDRYYSEYNVEPVFSIMERHNRSLPADTQWGGCVVYGSKSQLAKKAKSLKATAMLKSKFSDGIILEDLRSKLKICDSSYEPDEHWGVGTGKPLGHGTTGRCYPCIDMQTNFKFCAKKIPMNKFETDEVWIWSMLEHHDVVNLFGVILFEDHIYILQELITGPTLLERINDKECEKMDFYTILTIFEDLLEILKYFNKKGIIHNDIKADNIMIRDGSNRMVIIDFGLACQRDRVPAGEPPVGGQVHMSPEKAASEGYGHGADVWAATVVLVHMLAGIEPWMVRFGGKQFLHLIIKNHSPPLQDIPCDIPKEIRALIEKGWTVDANERPSAGDLLKHPAFNFEFLSGEIFTSCAIEPADKVEEFASMKSLTCLNSIRECDLEETENLISQAEEFLSRERAASISLSSSQIPRVLSFREPTDRFSSLRYHSQLSAVPECQLELQQEVRENKRGAFLEDEEEEEGEDLSVKYDDLSIGGYIYGSEMERGGGETNSLEMILSYVEDLQKKQDDVRNSNLGNLSNLASIMQSTGPNILGWTEETTFSNIPLVVEEMIGSDLSQMVDEMFRPNIPLVVDEMFHPNIPLVVEEASWVDSIEDQSLVELIQLGEDRRLDNMNPEEDENANVPSGGDVSEMPLQSTVEEQSTVATQMSSLFSLGWPSSDGATMGTTVIVMLDGEQVYALHLHPGCAPYWSEVALRASTEVHRHDVAAFMLEQQLNEDGDMEQVDINGEVPANARVTVHVRRVTDVQNWDWKLDGGKVIYNPASFYRQR